MGGAASWITLLALGSTLESVRIQPIDGGGRVVLQGTEVPNFTAFVEHRPFRVVVDWAGSDLGPVPRQRDFQHPDLASIRLRERVTEGEPVTRVEIFLKRPATFELRVERTEVWVDLDVDPTGLGPMDLMAEGPDRRGTRRTPAPDPGPVREESPEGRPLVEPKVPVPTAQQASVEIPDSEPEPVLWDGGELPPPPVDPEVAQLVAQEEARLQAERRAREEAERQRLAQQEAERLRLAQEEAERQRRAQQEAERVAREEAERDAARRKVASAAAPATSADPPSKPERQVLARFPPPASPSATAPSAPSALPPAVEVASEPVVLARFEPSQAAPDEPSAEPSYDPGRRVMTYIGFRQRADISRVFVRLDGRARFRQRQEGTTFVLELMDTDVNVKNNERPLDTTYFNSPVLRIQARPKSGNTRIEVRLRKTVPWQIKRIGNTIAIDFRD